MARGEGQQTIEDCGPDKDVENSVLTLNSGLKDAIRECTIATEGLEKDLKAEWLTKSQKRRLKAAIEQEIIDSNVREGCSEYTRCAEWVDVDINSLCTIKGIFWKLGSNKSPLNMTIPSPFFFWSIQFRHKD